MTRPMMIAEMIPVTVIDVSLPVGGAESPLICLPVERTTLGVAATHP